MTSARRAGRGGVSDMNVGDWPVTWPAARGQEPAGMNVNIRTLATRPRRWYAPASRWTTTCWATRIATATVDLSPVAAFSDSGSGRFPAPWPVSRRAGATFQPACARVLRERTLDPTGRDLGPTQPAGLDDLERAKPRGTISAEPRIFPTPPLTLCVAYILTRLPSFPNWRFAGRYGCS
jgi:hypothetical protein